MNMGMNVMLRPMLTIDVPAVAEILGDDPHAADQAKLSMRVVAVVDGAVVGVVLYTLGRQCVRIRRLAVHPAWRRRRIGSRLLAYIGSRLHPGRRTRAFVIVRDDSLSSHLFLRARGWRCVHVSRRLHQDGADGYFFETKVSESVEIV